MHARFHHFAAAHFAMSAGYDPQRVHDMAQAMLALLGLALLWGLSRTWCSRVERRIVISSGESFWQVYRGLLWRESWRSFVVTAAIGVLFAFGGRDPEDAGQKIGSVIASLITRADQVLGDSGAGGICAPAVSQGFSR